MADKRISQLIERVDIANNDVLPIVASGATTTNKVTISTIQDWMQENLDVGVTSVGITIGSTGTDVNVTGSPITSSGNITINIPTASATNRGLLSSADWTTFNSKQQAITLTTTGTSGAATLVSGTLNIPNYSTDLSGYVTLGTTQTITAQKTFTTSGSSDTMIISHGSGSGFALDVLKAGSGEAIRVTKTSGSGNAMTISGGNFEAGTIVKTGGTSSQFLKADGSVDSSTYLTTDTNQSITGFKSFVNGFSLASEGGTNQPTTFINTGSIHEGSASTNQIGFNNSNNIYFGKGLNNGGVLQWTNSAVRYYTLPDADGTLALTSDIPSLAGYVTLATTQTITGAKTFDTTTSDFLILNSTNASGGALTFRRNGTNVGHIGNSGVLGVGILDDLEVRSGISRALHLKTDGGKLTLSAGGSVTLDGALNGTSASFTGTVLTPLISVSGSAGNIGNINSTNANGGYITWQTSGTTIADLGSAQQIFGSGGSDTFGINARGARSLILGTNNTARLTLASTGAATFSSSVTATSLDVIGASGTEQFRIGNTTGGTDFGITVTENATTIINSAEGATGRGIQFQSGGVNTMTITSSGNVGIGTASPLYKLDVLGASGNVTTDTSNGTLINIDGGSITSTNFGVGIGFVRTGSQMAFIKAARENTSDEAGFLSFATQTGAGAHPEQMRITSGGTLKAKGTETTYHNIDASYHELRTGAGGQFTAAISNTAGTPFGLLIDYNSAPNNSSSEFLYCTDGIVSTLRAKILSNGGLSNFQANNTNLSDERTKKDIEPLESYWDKFKAIEIVKFKYKDQTHDDFNIGVIAQQVEAVAPEFVDIDGWNKPELDEEGNEIVSEEEPLKSIYTADLYHATIKVLQEAMAKIEELQIQIDSLKNQIK